MLKNDSKYQKVVSTGFLLHEKKTLIVQRSIEEVFLSGYYELPGGKVDFGEDPKEALRREYDEEVNLQIGVGEPFKVFSYISEDGQRHTVEILFFVYLIDPDRDRVQISSAHMDYQWVTKDEIERHAISLEMRDSINQGFQISSFK